MKQQIIRMIVFSLLAAIVIYLSIKMAHSAETGACGPGLAAQDIAGNCRIAKPCAVNPKENCYTAGALTATVKLTPPKPGNVKLIPKPGGVIIQNK
jgi:hypothetical protein